MIREDIKSIGIKLPNTAAIGYFDETEQERELFGATISASETVLGRAALALLILVNLVWVDRVSLPKHLSIVVFNSDLCRQTEMASRTVIDLIILAAVGSLRQGTEPHAHYISPEHIISEATFYHGGDPLRQLTVGGRVDYLLIKAIGQEPANRTSKYCIGMMSLTTRTSQSVSSEIHKDPAKAVLQNADNILVTPIEAKSAESMKACRVPLPASRN